MTSTKVVGFFFFLVDYQILTKLICGLFSKMKFSSNPKIENGFLFPVSVIVFTHHLIYQYSTGT
jgi:hypothetical protein